MRTWIETSLKGLYDGSVEAFPNTTRRQHSTDTVRVEGLRWVPFEGVGTLFVKALVRNEDRKNEPIILLKGVRYRQGPSGGVVTVRASNGREFHMESSSFADDDALVRCTCQDFRWRFCHWNGVDRSLFGRDRRRYEARLRPGSSNPDELPGMCKHLMKMAKILRESGVVRA